MSMCDVHVHVEGDIQAGFHLGGRGLDGSVEVADTSPKKTLTSTRSEPSHVHVHYSMSDDLSDELNHHRLLAYSRTRLVTLWLAT